MATNRPTIAELEAILQQEEEVPIDILPNGEVRARNTTSPAELGGRKPLTLREDLGDGDTTTQFFVPVDRQALGRVVAHELYHFLSNTTKHATAGLAAASHDWVELLSGKAAFREKDFQAKH